MSLNNIYIYFSLFTLLACCTGTPTENNVNLKIKEYCDNCKSDTQVVAVEVLEKSISSLFYLDSIRWKGKALSSIKTEGEPMNYLDSVDMQNIEKMGFTADTAIIDYTKHTFNKFGFLENVEITKFGDLVNTKLKLSYINDTTLYRIDLYSPIIYYQTHKPMKSFIFKNEKELYLIMNNIL